MTGIRRIVCGMVNCYLVTGEGGSVLVDTGEEPYKEKVLKACQGEDVKLIVLTHGHIDHIQNGAWLSRQLGVPIGMNEKDVELIENQFAQPLEGRGIFGKALAAASLRKMRKNRIERFVPRVFLEEGDSLEEFGVKARILELPGHTEGSIGLLVGRKAVIVGDTLMHMVFPGIASICGDERKLRESTKRIGGLGERKIYFGHGRPVSWKKAERFLNRKAD